MSITEPKREPRRKPKQSRSLETVERILTAAVKVLDLKGFDGFSMQAVADVASLAIGTIYQYFPDKYAILKILVQRWYAKSDDYSNFDASALPDIDYLARIYFEEPVGPALFEAIQVVPELREFDRAKVEATIQRIAEKIAGNQSPQPEHFAKARVSTRAIDGVLREAIRLPAADARLMTEELKRWIALLYPEN